MSARTRNLLLGALSLAVIAVTFFVVLPKIANYRDVWDVVRDLDPIWLDRVRRRRRPQRRHLRAARG